MKKKKEDIVALKKQLRLPPTIHPQTTEVAQQKEEEDVVSLLMRMHKILIETEGALEATLQGRQGGLVLQPNQVPLTLGTALPIVATSVPPTDITTTAAALASASTSANNSSSTYSSSRTGGQPKHGGNDEGN